MAKQQESKHPTLYFIDSNLLAKWLEDQGDEFWWSVDGDPTLMSQLSFPCPSSELASFFKDAHKKLVIYHFSGHGSVLQENHIKKEEDIDKLVQINDEHDAYKNRALTLTWGDQTSEDQWLLIEDKEIAQSSISAGTN